MINASALLDAIHQKGLKLGFVAEKMGVSRQTFALKLNGESEFKVSEIETLVKTLNLSTEQRDKIFFA